MKVGHENPVNSTAARVLGRGTHFDSGVKHGDAIYQDTPLPTRKPGPSARKDPSFIDLCGVQFGRFRVIGLSATASGRWVVRCACGIYSLRSAKAIRNPNNDMDCCAECRNLLFLKRAELKRRTGRDVAWRDLV